MELRQRQSRAEAEAEATSAPGFAFRPPTQQDKDGFPSPGEMVEAHPGCKHGYLSKRNTSMMSQLLPCCARKWKSRFFCLIGSFLYRFSSFPDGAVKGVPIPLEACSIRTLDEGDIGLDPGEDVGACFELSMIRKQYIFMASSRAEAAEWVSALRARKLASIKESLGHAPVSQAVRALNAKAAKKFRLRVDQDRVEGEERLKEFSRQSAALNPMMASGLSAGGGRGY